MQDVCILRAAQVLSGIDEIPPRHLSVENEYIACPDSLSRRQGPLQGHSNNVLQMSQVVICLQELQGLSQY